jgi:ABC-2 type transport system permease protein
VSTVAAPRSHSNQPGLTTAIRVELAKLTSQLPLRIALLLCAVVPVAVAVLMRVASTRPTDTLFGRWAGTTGFATSLTVLNWAVAWGVPLLAGLVAGDVFAGEDRHGTWKTILTRSCTRTRLFLGKAVAATLCVWFGFAVIGVVSTAAGLAVVGSSPMPGLSGQLIEPGRALGLVAASWALSLLWSSVFIAGALLLSVASRSGIVGVLGPLVAAIVLQLLQTVASGRIVRALLPTTPAESWHALFTAPAHPGPVVQGVLTTLAYTAVFAGAAWFLLRRRDFAGSGTTLRPCALARVGVAAAAVGAVLGGLSTVGPTALTAERLDTSVATTFGHLVEIRYQWESERRPDTTIPWRATCDRGADKKTTRGAGDDWACTVTDLRPADGVGPTMLEVNLKANGCYEVQAPAGAVGGLYVTSRSGRRFLNPLYAFDGCLGTP